MFAVRSSQVVLILVLICVTIIVEGMQIISKKEWHGKNATKITSLDNQLNYVIIHHTAGNYCTMRDACNNELQNMQYYHMEQLHYDDIAYNFLIDGMGSVYEGRGWNVMGAHAKAWNTKSLGISLMGNYNKHKPNVEQLTAAENLLADAVSRGQLMTNYTVFGHRQVGNTECPGNHLYADIQKWPYWRTFSASDD